MKARYCPCFSVKLLFMAQKIVAACGPAVSAPPMLSTRASIRPGARDLPKRLQNRLVHLLRVKPKASGVCLHDCDSADEAQAAFPFLFQFFCERADLSVEVILLDCRASDEGILSLPLL